ncbi:MAG: large repetitive protein [Solirubrobacterales bacterium]|nr:large repetitive protein [Solirubrobacterales bacterium]
MAALTGLCLGVPQSAAAATLTVDDDSACAGAAYTTIKAAVEAAATGDTIQVCPGVYSEAVAIDKPLTLLGAQAGVDARTRALPDSEETILDGTNAPNGGGFVVSANRVKLDGFLVRDVAGTFSGAGIALMGGTQGHDIYNTIFRGNTFGLYLNNAPAEETHVRHNLFDTNTALGAASGNAIYSDMGTSNVAIDENRFQGQTNAAVLLNTGSSGSGITISDNDLVSDSEIRIYNSSAVTISGNRLIDPRSDGIVLAGGNSGVVIARNTVENAGPGSAAVRLFSAGLQVPSLFGPNQDVSITGNSLHGDGDEYGIRVGGSTLGPLAPAGADIDLGPPAYLGALEAHFNRIAGNQTGVSVSAPTAWINADNNWWGCNAGPGEVGCDSAIGFLPGSAAGIGPGSIDAEPNLLLGASADPAAIANNGERSTVTASLAENSDGETPAPNLFPTGVSLRFATTLGSVETPRPTTGPTATSMLTAGSESGVATVSAGLDAQTATAEVEIHDVLPPETSLETGPSGSIDDDTPTFGFSSSQAGSSFECRVDDDPFAACSGPGQTHTTDQLGDGEHVFEVRAVDPAGNIDPSAASRSFTVAVPPQTSIDSGPSAITHDDTPSFGFSSSETGSSFECRLDDAAFDACSGPGATHTTTALADGDHVFEVRATDPAGNVDASPASLAFTVAVPPQTSIDAGPAGRTDDDTPSFEFSSSDAGSTFECRIDDASFEACSGPGATHTTAPLSDGDHVFEVRATDPSGNVDESPASRSFTVGVPPETSIETGPSETTADDTPTFGFSSSEPSSSFECRVDDDPFGPCSGPGPTHTTMPLSDGGHVFEVRATDPAGNLDQSPASRSFTVAVAPQTTIGPEPAGTIDDATPTFLFSSDEEGSSFECRVDDDPFGACSGPGASHTPAPLAEGDHVFEVRATDRAGNLDATPASRSFTVAIPPQTAIDSGPSGDTEDDTPSFGFSSSDAGSTFECRVDDDPFEACSGPGATHTTAPLSDGDHAFEVRATDPNGNLDASPASRSFTVAIAPQTTIDTGPSGTTADDTPSFGFSSSEAGSTFQCRVDDDPFGSCSGPGATHTPAPLADGDHVFEVAARDSAGNRDPSPASRSFKVAVPPPPGPCGHGLIGDASNNTLVGGSGPDRIRGLAGDDLLRGQSGRDCLNGDNGDDRLYGGDGDDDLSGGTGDDLLRAGEGNDVLVGGPGEDEIFAVGGGFDVIRCNAGIDLVHADKQDQISPSCERVTYRP